METMAQVTEVFREVFLDPKLVITPETNASHVKGWDSFAHLSLIVALEERFKVSFTTKEISSLTCVGDLIKVLEGKLGK